MKQLIKNGKIYNGTENEPFMGEILIEDDKIAGIYNYAESKGYDGEDVDKVYDIFPVSWLGGTERASGHGGASCSRPGVRSAMM